MGTVYEEHEELYIPIPDDIAEDEPKLLLHAVFINRLDKYPIVNLCSWKTSGQSGFQSCEIIFSHIESCVWVWDKKKKNFHPLVIYSTHY